MGIFRFSFIIQTLLALRMVLRFYYLMLPNWCLRLLK